MRSALDALLANPGLLVAVLLLGIGGLVIGTVAVMMARAGRSLRPVI